MVYLLSEYTQKHFTDCTNSLKSNIPSRVAAAN